MLTPRWRRVDDLFADGEERRLLAGAEAGSRRGATRSRRGATRGARAGAARSERGARRLPPAAGSLPEGQSVHGRQRRVTRCTAGVFYK